MSKLSDFLLPRVVAFFQENPTASIGDAAKAVKRSYSSVVYVLTRHAPQLYAVVSKNPTLRDVSSFNIETPASPEARLAQYWKGKPTCITMSDAMQRINMYEAGYTYTEIGEAQGVGAWTIQQWFNRHFEPVR